MKDLRFHSFLIAWMKFRVMKFRIKDQMLNAWECDTVVGVILWSSCCRWMKKIWLALINAETFSFWARNDWLLFLAITVNQTQNDWFLFLAMTVNQTQNDWLLLILNDCLLIFSFWMRKKMIVDHVICSCWLHVTCGSPSTGVVWGRRRRPQTTQVITNYSS